MRRIGFALMWFVAPGWSQTPAKEPDTLQALLVEVHQLRQDIAATMVASQRVQIALYALQMQDAAVARSAQRLDNARNKCSGAENNQARVTGEVQRLETRLASGGLTDAETKELQIVLTHMKGEIEAQSTELQSCQTAEAQASTQLR